MNNLITSYLLAQYYTQNHRYIDFPEWVAQGISIADYRSSDLDLFISVYQLVKTDQSIDCKSIIELLTNQQFTEAYIPFYLLPFAFATSYNMEEVVEKVKTIATSLVHNKLLQLETLIMVASIKWALDTHSSALVYINKCPIFDAAKSYSGIDVLRKTVNIFKETTLWDFEEKTSLDKVIHRVCHEGHHASVLAVLSTALFEADNLTDYTPELVSPYSAKMPLTSNYSCDWDRGVNYGYQRLDGYMAWVMQSQKEVLNGGILISDDKSGPNRDIMRIWHWLNKYLNWSQLYEAVDKALHTTQMWEENQDWQQQIQSRYIDYTAKKVCIKLKYGKYPLKFSIHMKLKEPKFDYESLLIAFRRNYTHMEMLPKRFRMTDFIE